MDSSLARSLIQLSYALILACLFAACGGSGSNNDDKAPNPTPEAVLAISSLPRLEPTPATIDELITVLNEAFSLAYDAGARGQMTTKHWYELEPQSGNYDEEIFDSLNSAIDNAMTHDMQQFVGLQLINTTQREMPADLTDAAFDDTRVIQQFELLLDKLLDANPGKIRYLSIGNEVDVYLRAHPEEWTPYKSFFTAIVAYVHEKAPAIEVGVTATAEGALTLSTAELQDLNDVSDVVMLTYYPLDFAGDGTVSVRAPESPDNDFSAMIDFAGDKKVVLQEVGYPASALNTSSQTLQASFVEHVFSAWKQHAEQIPFLNYFVLHDFTQQTCDEYTLYYGMAGFQNAESFSAYLCSLGLRGADGTPKAAWNTLLQQTQQADFITR